jgi:UDP-N-acetylmuramoylalanine--D-glutamate ligase
VGGNPLRLHFPGRKPVEIDLTAFRLRGAHNRENAAAAALAAMAAGADMEGIRAALAGFRPAAHRLEPIATINGVSYVNDSKATNVDAVRRALESFEPPVVLIMGGLDKGGRFGLLRDAVRSRCRALILMGAAAGTIRSELGGLTTTAAAASMRAAVEAASQLAAGGDMVLLAPGCASFDRYANYQERGDDFRREVMRLAAANGNPPADNAERTDTTG